MNIFLKFLHSAADLQTYLNIFLQCQGRTNGGATPFQVEVIAENQPNLKLCWKICCAILSSQSMRRSGDKSSHFSANITTLGIIATSRCNNAVGNINSTEKFHRLALRSSKIYLQRVGK